LTLHGQNKLTPYQLELRRQQNDVARTERQRHLNQRISFLAQQSDSERQRRRTLALAKKLEQREQRCQAQLISDDELDNTNLLTGTESAKRTFDYIKLCTGVLLLNLLSLPIATAQKIIANGR
jgi:hypothetical protein